MTAAAGTLVSEETPERSRLLPVEKLAAFQIGLYFGAQTLAARGLSYLDELLRLPVQFWLKAMLSTASA